MKVAYCDSYGPPEMVQIREIAKPTVKSNQVLVKVIASAVTVADSRIRGARFPKGLGLLARISIGFTKPRSKVLGSTFSGVVQSIGENVNNVSVGEQVCGVTGLTMGTHAEYVLLKKPEKLVKKPKNLSHQDVVGAIFGGTTALYFLRDKVKIRKGESVLINGASGAVGTNAVQLAKHFGARVTGVTSGDNAKLVKSLGAEHVIDYTKQNVVDLEERFDVVIDCVGNISAESGLKLLKNNSSRLALVVADLKQMLASTTKKQILIGSAFERPEDIAYLVKLLHEKKLKTVVDKVYPLDKIVEAHKHVDTGKKVGNVILLMNQQ